MDGSVVVGHHKYGVVISETAEKDGFVVGVPVAGVKRHVREFSDWRLVAKEILAVHASRVVSFREGV